MCVCVRMCGTICACVQCVLLPTHSAAGRGQAHQPAMSKRQMPTRVQLTIPAACLPLLGGPPGLVQAAPLGVWLPQIVHHGGAAAAGAGRCEVQCIGSIPLEHLQLGCARRVMSPLCLSVVVLCFSLGRGVQPPAICCWFRDNVLRGICSPGCMQASIQRAPATRARMPTQRLQGGCVTTTGTPPSSLTPGSSSGLEEEGALNC